MHLNYWNSYFNFHRKTKTKESRYFAFKVATIWFHLWRSRQINQRLILSSISKRPISILCHNFWTNWGSAPQNECLNFSFLKNSRKFARDGQKMAILAFGRGGYQKMMNMLLFSEGSLELSASHKRGKQMVVPWVI